VLAENSSPFRTMPIAVEDARTAALLHGVVPVTHVVHFGDDVTVRYFTPKLPSHPESVGQYQVLHMGEDVLVRYFASVVRNPKTRPNRD